MNTSAFPPGRCVFWTALALLLAAPSARGDGRVFRPRDYKGSLEERSQEAIIIFNTSEAEGGSSEDLILKIEVAGRADKFACVIPFPQEPKVEKEDGRLFRELFDYVEAREPLARRERVKSESKDTKKSDERPVEVLSRRDVGSYDVAVVRENEAGALNRWLAAEGFQPLPDDAEDVVGFYRRKGYVFACVKVKDATPGGDGTSPLHPLRFSFRTGGYDGIYFPMKLTGLQTEPFDVNLYVFFRYWINDDLSKHGYVHRGFHLRYRDWDSPRCEPNAGKSYSAPEGDPFLRSSAHLFPTVTTLFQKLHPGERYYLTNIRASGLKPADVRQWSDDLWLFPYNAREGWIPHDARPSGVASAAWPNDVYEGDEGESKAGPGPALPEGRSYLWLGAGFAAVVACLALGVLVWWRRAAGSAVRTGN
jgi:hypothetical protein